MDYNKYDKMNDSELRNATNMSLDFLRKYGVAELNRNMEINRNLDPKIDKQTLNNRYIYYRKLINDELIKEYKEKDARIMRESLTIYRWGDSMNDENNTDQVLFAPLSFYNINRSKVTNIQDLPGSKTSLKEYYTTSDYTIQAQCLFYTHMRNEIPEDFIKRFEEMMDYDGIIAVDNLFLNRFKINYIYVTDFAVNQSNITNNQNTAFTALSEENNII